MDGQSLAQFRMRMIEGWDVPRSEAAILFREMYAVRA